MRYCCCELKVIENENKWQYRNCSVRCDKCKTVYLDRVTATNANKYIKSIDSKYFEGFIPKKSQKKI